MIMAERSMSKRKNLKCVLEAANSKEVKHHEQENKVAPPLAKIAMPDSLPATPEPPAPVNNRPPRELQCYNCQLWGHCSFECIFDSCCVKCGKSHRTSECLKKKEVPPTCALCVGPHTASYRGCKLAPKSHRRRRPQLSRSQPDLSVKSSTRKFIKVLFNLFVKKDFFTEEQLADIAKEMNDKPATKEASAQTKEIAAVAMEVCEPKNAKDEPHQKPMKVTLEFQALPREPFDPPTEPVTQPIQPELKNPSLPDQHCKEAICQSSSQAASAQLKIFADRKSKDLSQSREVKDN